MTAVLEIQNHIKKANGIIKKYRAEAKRLNNIAEQLAQSNAKLKRQLNKAIK